MKKFLVVALTLALTMAFIGCEDHSDEIKWSAPPPAGEEEEEGYKLVANLAAYEKDDTKGFYYSDGMDDKTGTGYPTMAQFKAAKYLILEMAAAPKGGVQFIWQGDGNSYGWADYQVDICGGTGTPDAAKGASYEDGMLVIELSKAVVDYTDKFLTSTKVKFILAYYSPDIDGLKITKAWLAE